jgi:hypothetical protein
MIMVTASETLRNQYPLLLYVYRGKNWVRMAIFLRDVPSLTLIPHLMTNHLSQLLNGSFRSIKSRGYVIIAKQTR